MAYDPFIVVDLAPTRKLAMIEIPYGEYVIKITCSTDPAGHVREEEYIEILAADGNQFVPATKDFVPNIREDSKIHTTGDNLMKVMSMVYNEVNKED